MSFTVLQLFAGATALKLVGRISKLIAEKAWEDINLWLLVGLLLFVVKYFIDDLMDVNHLMNGNLHKEDKYRYLKLCVLAVGWLFFYGGLSLYEQDKIVEMRSIGIFIGILLFTVLLFFDSNKHIGCRKCYRKIAFLQNLIILINCILVLLSKFCVGLAVSFAIGNLLFMLSGICFYKNKRQK